MAKSLLLRLFLLLSFFVTNLDALYIQRYATTDNGGILFTGNTLGLSKFFNQNQPGTEHSIGAFITTNTLSQVGNYLPGTTLNWMENGSYAYLDLPVGSTVLYAELIWSGSYGWQGQITGNEPNLPVTLITPQNVNFSIPSDPATRQEAVTPGVVNKGNYVRSANVTSIVQGGGAGKYTVGGVPATISALDNTHNAAGWTLAVVYRDGLSVTQNMILFVGCEQASNQLNNPAAVSGFCAPPSGDLNANLFVSAIEGDANLTGDRMLFGPSVPLNFNTDALFGINNPLNNFFCSQINTLVPLTYAFVPTKLVTFSSAGLDTRGSFGDFNSNPFTGTVHPGDRQGYDITSVDISDQIDYNQTVAYALGISRGDDYTINALGIQIQVGAPTIASTKTVDSQLSINALVGDVVTFDFTFENIGTADANALIFKDLLEAGLTYVPNSFYLNAVLQPDPNLVSGFAIGNLLIGQSATIQFQATINSYPAMGNTFENFGTVDYSFQTCFSETINVTANTNFVDITLPSLEVPNLVSSKLVNGATEIESSVGEVVSFQFDITNTGTGAALNSIFKDVLQTGLVLVPESVLVDDVVVIPDPDLAAGFSIGIIEPGQTVKVIFNATITSFPQAGSQYFNSATIDYQYMPFEGVFEDLVSETNQVIINMTPAPPFFDGTVTKCKALNGTTYCLTAVWPPASDDVILYRVYHNGVLVKEIPAAGPLVFKACAKSKRELENYELSAVYPGGIESDRVPLILNF